MDRILNPENKSNRLDEYESSLRPSRLDEYIGQKKVKKNLKIFIEASKIREEAIDHIFLFGCPGLGKTTLAHIISNEMGSKIKVIAAPMLEKSGDLASIITNLDDKDILFIDEIHRLSPAVEEILYSAMEDFRLDIVIGNGVSAKTIKIDLPRFTLIGSTTRAGSISSPLRDRFGIHFRLSFYTKDELATIVKLASKKLKVNCDNDAALEIGKRCRGTPRIAIRILKRIRDFAEVKKQDTISLEITNFALEELNINKIGLDEMDIRLLKIFIDGKNAPTGLKTISSILSEDEKTVEDVVEPYLISEGYIRKTPKGRVATEKASKLFNNMIV